ncbi:MAG: hypothetical protein Q9217_001143 [Psora testacea]
MLSFPMPASYHRRIDHGYLLNSPDEPANSFQCTQNITTSAATGSQYQQLDLCLTQSNRVEGFHGPSATRGSPDQEPTCGDCYHCDNSELHGLHAYEPENTAGENTDSIPDRTELGWKRSRRYPLHERGFNINGRLPCDAPLYRAREGEQVMEDVATQPATQPFLDPRRQGTKSMLSEQDEGDVLCILLPSSRPALKAVDLVAEASPQHLLQNYSIDDIPEAESDLPHETTTSTRQDSDNEETQLETDTQSSDEVRSSRPARDIALRMTSRVHNPCLGFVFGRNPKRCDLLISSDSVMKVSNSHFRIFLNRHGVLMLEDTSTNGTFVDKVLLRSGKGGSGKGTGPPSTRTLNAGAIIELPTVTRQAEETIRFIVRFPSRDQAQEQYNLNLAAYLVYIQQAERQLQVAAAGKGDMPPPVLMPFNAMKDKAGASPNASILAAATGDYNHGLNWNGGEKYNVVSYVGKGAFAMVYKLSAKKDGEVYACKQIEKRRFIKDGVLNHKVHNEILVMKDLEHPHIVKYIEYHETKIHIFIVMEFVSYGDLSIYTESGTAMHEYMCQIMATQIIQALAYLHNRKITHRDIKPDNILVASHFPYIFKLSDFGLSKIVNNEETFLKSFCGTLLYCAPEIYPGFQRAKLGLHPSKRRRSWEPRKGTQPGSMEDEGAMMLMNIMKAPPNWERLEQAGISAEGIDFIKRILVIEPSLRAQEAELLRHPWIDPNGPSLEEIRMHTGGDGGDDLDASQLSLADKVVPQVSEDIVDETEDYRETKRSKHFQLTELEPEIDLFGSIGHGQAWAGASDNQWTENQPLNIANAGAFVSSRPAQGSRLFGEIGSSALRSSGVLGQDAHAALQVSPAESHDPFLNQSSEKDSEMESAEGVCYADINLNGENYNTNATSAQHSLQYPQLLPGPTHTEPATSLLGAEALVGQLNMASPESGVSGASADSKPASPLTPASRDASPGLGEEKLSTQSRKSQASGMTPRQLMAGQAEQGLESAPQSAQSPANYGQPDLTRPIDHTAIVEPYSTFNTGSHLPRSHDSSGSSDAQSYSCEQRLHDPNKSDISLLPTAFNSQGSEQYALSDANPGLKAPSPQTSSSQTVIATTATVGPGPRMISPAAVEQTESFAKPPLRFGNLIPTPGSIATVTIKITSQATTFGRDPHSDFVHPNIREDRIPKNALDISMWYPNIERDIACGKTDWHLNESLIAILSTRTTRHVKVNGTRLMKGSGCWLYGKLKTGDVITVFGPPEGVNMAGMDGKQKEYLRFRCEFFVGGSKEPRGQEEPFVVEKEEEKYKQYEVRKSRESSAAKSRESSVAAVGVGE